MKTILKPLFGLLVALALTQPLFALTRAERLRAQFDSADTNYVFVVAHRCDWRHHPENSLSGIAGAIAMGCDMVEIDVAKTKDGVLVLSHDGKLNRVSNRKGKISDLTLAEVKAARLREGQGGSKAKLTDEHVPTLEEALTACKGQILVNIDKFHVDRKQITDVIAKLGFARQVVLKGKGDYAQVKKNTGAPWQQVASREFVYMPVLGGGKDADGQAAVRRQFAAWDSAPYVPPAYEVCIPNDPPRDLFDDMRRSPNHPRLWINTLWDSLAHDHSETLPPAEFSADRVWGWCLDLGATLIQTDRPADAIRYLESRGRHTLP